MTPGINTPMKVENKHVIKSGYRDRPPLMHFGRCPICKQYVSKIVGIPDNGKSCNNCGQALDWSEDMNDVIKDFLIKIMSSFPHSFIKYYVYGGFEITLDEQNVLCFSLEEIGSDLELKRRFISVVSRCYKTQPYRTSKRNIEWQQKHISAFNKALGTKFNADEIAYIYTYLGNGCNKPIAIKFIESGYDLNVLKQLIDGRTGK